MRLRIPALTAASLLGMTLLLGNTAAVQAQETKTKPAHERGHGQKGVHSKKTDHSPKPRQAHKAAHAQYECARCNIVTTKAGNCPACKMKMTKISAANAKKAQSQASFECAHCQLRSAKGGKCPLCKMPMKKMAKPAKSS